MAITYHGLASTPVDAGSNSTSPTVITPPGSMSSGDLVVVVCFNRLKSDTHAVYNNGGQSWTKLTTQTTTGAFTTATWFYCVYDGTWDANPSFSHGGTNNTCMMMVFRPTSGYTWSVDVTEAPALFSAPGSPYDVTITGITCASASVAIASWASSDDNTWAYQSGTSWTQPTGATVNNTAGSDSGVLMAYRLMPSGGASGSPVGRETTVGGDPGCQNIMSFKEAMAASPIAGSTAGGGANTVSGTLKGRGKLYGASAGISTPAVSGTLTAKGKLYGSSAGGGANTVSANLTMYHRLIGHTCANLHTRLKGYFKLEEASGDAVNEVNASYPLYDGSTPPTYHETGKSGYGMSFGNGTNCVLDNSTIYFAPTGNEYSISFWTKLKTLPSVEEREFTLVRLTTPSTPWDNMILYVYNVDDKLHFTVRNTSGYQNGNNDTAWVIDTWYHVTLVVREVGQTVALYVNTDIDYSSQLRGHGYYPHSSIYVGNQWQGGPDWANAIIDELMFYDRALTADEVSTLYASGDGFFYPFPSNKVSGTLTGKNGISGASDGIATVGGTLSTTMIVPVSATGDGSLCADLQLECTVQDCYMTVDGNGMFYDNEGGTENPGTSRTITFGAQRQFWLKVTSGSCNVTIRHYNNLYSFYWLHSGTNYPTTSITTSGLARCLDTLNMSGSNTFSGDFVDLPPNLKVLQGQDTQIYGALADLPRGMTSFGVYGMGTVTGVLTDLPSGLIYFYFASSGGNITGDISDLPSGLLILDLYGSSTISGDLADLPAGVRWFNIATVSTIKDYTQGHVWPATTNNVSFNATTDAAGLSPTEVDNLIIDVNTYSTAVNGSIYLVGYNSGRTSASDTAYNALIADGWTITTKSAISGSSSGGGAETVSGTLTGKGALSSLGAELIVNGGFDNGGSGWTTFGESTVNTGVGRIYSSDGSPSYLYEEIGLVSGHLYKVVFDVIATISDWITLGQNGNEHWVDVSETGIKIEWFTSDHDSWMAFKRSGITDVSIDNVSVKEVITVGVATVSGTLTAKGALKGAVSLIIFENFQEYNVGALAGQHDWVDARATLQIGDYSGDKRIYSDHIEGENAYKNIPFNADQFAEVKCDSIGNGYIGVAVRETGTGATWDGYVLTYNVNITTGRLYKITDGGWAQLGNTSTYSVQIGDIIRLEVRGNVLSCYINGVLDTTVATNGQYTDSDYASGFPGLNWYCYSITGDPTGDDFKAGAFVTTIVGTLKAKGSLAGSSSGVATVEGVLKGKSELTGVSDGFAIVSGDLTPAASVGELVGQTDGIADVLGTLKGAGRLYGATAGIADVSAFLRVQGGNLLYGSSDGIATVSGTIKSNIQGEGSATGVASVLGILRSRQPISGIISGVALLSGTLKAKGELAGTIGGVALLGGILKGKGELQGSTDGVATVSGIIASEGYATGATDGVAVVSGTLKGAGKLYGSATGIADVSGVVQAKGKLYGATDGDAFVDGLLTQNPHIYGATDGIAVVGGTLEGTGKLQGSITGVASLWGSLALGQIMGRTDGTATVGGAIHGHGKLSGATGGVATVSGTIKSKIHGAGSISGITTVGGSLKGKGELLGEISGFASVSGTIKAKGTLYGSTGGVALLGGVLGGKGDLSGEILSYATLSATLTATGDLAGRTDGIANVSGFIAVPGMLRGSIVGVAAVSGTIRSFIYAQGSINGVASVSGEMWSYILGELITGNSLITSLIEGNSSILELVDENSTITELIADNSIII